MAYILKKIEQQEGQKIYLVRDFFTEGLMRVTRSKWPSRREQEGTSVQ